MILQKFPFWPKKKKRKKKSLSAVDTKILCKTYFYSQILLIPCVLLLVELGGLAGVFGSGNKEVNKPLLPQLGFKTKPQQIPCAGRGRGRLCVRAGQDGDKVALVAGDTGAVGAPEPEGLHEHAELSPWHLSPALQVPVPAWQPCIPAAWKSSTPLPTPGISRALCWAPSSTPPPQKPLHSTEPCPEHWGSSAWLLTTGNEPLRPLGTENQENKVTHLMLSSRGN